MRSYGLVLAALVVLASYSARAQQAQKAPAAPAAAPAADAKLDEHLAKWEGALKNVETLGAQLMRIDKDPYLR